MISNAEDENSDSGNIDVFPLPFLNIEQHRKGSINQTYEEARFSESYEKVLQCLQTSEAEQPRVLSSDPVEVEFQPHGLGEDVKRVVKEKLQELVIRRRKMKEKYVDEYRWRKETIRAQITEPDRMLWGSGFYDFDSTSDFFVTPPGYNHFASRTPHWADRVGVAGATREKSRDKVTTWLSDYCE